MADDADAADALGQASEPDDAPIEPADADDTEGDDEPIEPAEPGPRRHQRLWLSVTAALLMVAAVGALAGWLGFRADESRQRALQREVFLQAARQGALNLTTISYTEVDNDIKRILDSSTGAFCDDFQKRSQPFIDVVKQAKSKSQGTITAAGLESVQGDTAQALVGVAVMTSNAGVSEQQPRAWRMRISVQKIGDAAKVSNVEFVP
jgi:Mce-associated membrane protein